MEHPAQVTREAVPLGHTGHLIHKATLPSLGVKADGPNAHKESAQIGKQRNKSQMKEQENTTEKEFNRNKLANIYRVQKNCYKDAQGT